MRLAAASRRRLPPPPPPAATSSRRLQQQPSDVSAPPPLHARAHRRRTPAAGPGYFVAVAAVILYLVSGVDGSPTHKYIHNILHPYDTPPPNLCCGAGRRRVKPLDATQFLVTGR